MITYKCFTEERIYNCYSCNIASLSHLLQSDYEIMFLNNWSFRFDLSKAETEGLGGAFYYNEEYSKELLEEYHGIKVFTQEVKTKEDFYAVYQSNQLQEIGCAIQYDSYYCPWLCDFQNIHYDHQSLVCGLNEQGDLICSDGIPAKENGTLPVDSIFSSDKPVKLLYIKKTAKEKVLDYTSHFKKQQEQFCEDQGFYETMIEYSQLLGRQFEVKKENIYAGTAYWNRTPLFTDIQKISRLRASYGYALGYLYKRYQEERLLCAEKIITKLSDSWYELLLNLWKIFIKSNVNMADTRSFLQQYVMLCAEKEKEAAQEFYRMFS